MEIKLVSNPVQDDNTPREQRQHVFYGVRDNELKEHVPHWCVKTHTILQRQGGVMGWLRRLEDMGITTVYLYNIRAEVVMAGAIGLDGTDMIEDVLYTISADIKIENDKVGANDMVEFTKQAQAEMNAEMNDGISYNDLHKKE